MILGIDPGLSGAWAVVSLDGRLIDCGDMPVAGVGAQTRVDAATLANTIRDFGAITAGVVEQVSSMPGQGVASTFKFGVAYGASVATVAACGLRLILVPPAAWKKAYRLTSDKEQARQRAIETWPDMAKAFARKKDHGRAEAALIARWGIGR